MGLPGNATYYLILSTTYQLNSYIFKKKACKVSLVFEDHRVPTGATEKLELKDHPAFQYVKTSFKKKKKWNDFLITGKKVDDS